MSEYEKHMQTLRATMPNDPESNVSTPVAEACQWAASTIDGTYTIDGIKPMTHEPLPTGPFNEWPNDEKKRLYALMVDRVPIEYYYNFTWIPRHNFPDVDFSYKFRLARQHITLSPALKEVLKNYKWLATDKNGVVHAYENKPYITRGFMYWEWDGELTEINDLHGWTPSTYPWDESLVEIENT